MQTERNAPCPCGSGKKYKKCCLTQDVTLHFPKPVNESYRDFQKLGGEVQAKLLQIYTQLNREEAKASFQEFLNNPLMAPRDRAAFQRSDAFSERNDALLELMVLNGLRMPNGQLLHEYSAQHQTKRFTSDELQILQRMCGGQLGLYQIEDLFPETHRVRVRDLLRDRVVLSHDVKLSQSGPRFLILLGKVIYLPEIEAHILYTLSSFAMDPAKKSECLAQLKKCAETLEPGCSRTDAWVQVIAQNPIAFYWLDSWNLSQDFQPKSISMVHKSGQPWVVSEIEYHCRDFNGAVKGLRRKRVLTEAFEGEKPPNPESLAKVLFHWIDAEDSLLATLELDRKSSHLRVTCPTRKHAADMRRKLATLDGLTETGYSEKPMSPSRPERGGPLVDLSPENPDALDDEVEIFDEGVIPQEMVDQLQKRFIDDLYDQPIPMLKNLSPAQAVKNKAMRQAVIEWLEGMEHHYSVGNPIMRRLNTDSLRARLGL